MRKLISFFLFGSFIFVGCTHSNSNTAPDYTKAITNTRMWSGVHARGYSGGLLPNDPINFNYTITDSSIAIVKLADNKVLFPVVNIPLTYRGTDSTAHTVKFDSSVNGSFSPTLTYYYLADSITFSYTILSAGVYGMDDPIEEDYYLHTQK